MTVWLAECCAIWSDCHRNQTYSGIIFLNLKIKATVKVPPKHEILDPSFLPQFNATVYGKDNPYAKGFYPTLFCYLAIQCFWKYWYASMRIQFSHLHLAYAHKLYTYAYELCMYAHCSAYVYYKKHLNTVVQIVHIYWAFAFKQYAYAEQLLTNCTRMLSVHVYSW